MSSRVFRHVPLGPDERLGHVANDGRVFEDRFGPDKLIGRVELGTGKIYETRVGPDKYVGRVELDSGKVFRAQLGPDEYLGRVSEEGQFHRHAAIAPDPYIGKITDMPSRARPPFSTLGISAARIGIRLPSGSHAASGS